MSKLLGQDSEKYTNTYLSRPSPGRNNHVCGCDENINFAHPVTRKDGYALKKFHTFETSKIQLLRRPPAVSSVMDGRTDTPKT